MKTTIIFLFLAGILPLACGDDGGDDPDAAQSSKGSGNDSGNGSGGGGEACAEACASLAEDCGGAAGEEQCVQTCSSNACAACLVDSAMCGGDCIEACAGGNASGDDSVGGGSGETGDTFGDEESGDSANSDDEGGDSGPIYQQCVRESDCDTFFGEACLGCELNFSVGYCGKPQSCDFDSDCLSGNCGYIYEDDGSPGYSTCTPVGACG